MKANGLTDGQQRALNIIRRHLKTRGVPPSRSELAAEMQLKHVSGVDGYLNRLAAKGFLLIHPGVERGLVLTREGAPILHPDELPAVAAGTPRLAEEAAEPPRLNDFDSFSAQFQSPPSFFVQVTGDSMEKVGFRTGDIVAVRQTPEANDGDVVIARIQNEITMKRYRKTKSHIIELEPESFNEEHKTLRVDSRSEDVEIIGIVVGAIIGAR